MITQEEMRKRIELKCLSIAKMLLEKNKSYGNFKKRISEKLAEIFGEKMDCDVMEEAWRDG